MTLNFDHDHEYPAIDFMPEIAGKKKPRWKRGSGQASHARNIIVKTMIILCL